MTYMLDSNTCAFIMNGRHGVVERFRQALPSGICVSSIVLSELEYGASADVTANGKESV